MNMKKIKKSINYIALYCIIQLYYIVLYCIVLYYSMLYCITLHCIITLDPK